MAKPPQTYTTTSLRLDDDLMEMVRRDAEANERTVAAHIRHLVRTALTSRQETAA